MKVIFLDIDGVLNPVYYMAALHKMEMNSQGLITTKDAYGQLFFDQNVQALFKIIGATGARIVLSSTWRMAGLPKMKNMWLTRGLPGTTILDITPVMNTARGEEIAEWLRNNEVDSYCIIDDDDDMLPEQLSNFVQTNPNYGLTIDDAHKAIEILNRK